MHRSTVILCGLFATAIASIALTGCSRRSKSFAPEVDAAVAGEKAIEQYDANGDGKISGAEFDKAGSLKSSLAISDTDNDKALTAEEIANRIRSWQTTSTLWARTPLHCKVYHDKQFLDNAEVKFVPEKFLGEEMKIVRGKTSSNGVAFLKVENSAPGDPPGVGPGFYRVEITKEGQEIPAKYNTETILGIDTSMDNPLLLKGVRFDLSYPPPKQKRK